jgi:GMP synthase-like glutamine amidotransferase
VPARALFLRNDPTAREALLGEFLADAGFDITTFAVVPPDGVADPTFEVSFPDPGGFDVIVPLGSRWAAHDDRLPWVAAEMDLVRLALQTGAGVLGVCFGGQLLARALGGTVARSPHPEIGWHEVHSRDSTLVPDGPWFQWHFDRFTLPPGATLIAENNCAPQAFVSGRALGLQFHPELDRDLLEEWIADDTDGDIDRLGIDADLLRERTDAEAGDAARRLRLLVKGFLGMLGEHGANHAPHPAP